MARKIRPKMPDIPQRLPRLSESTQSSNLPNSSNLPTPVVRLDLPSMGSYSLSEKDISSFMKEIDRRSAKDNLFRTADRAQAFAGLQSVAILQGLYELLRDEGMPISGIDDIQKIITSCVKANDAVNKTFKQLGVNSADRKEEIDTDPLSEMLEKVILENYCPPSLQDQYILAKKDIEKTEDGVSYDEEDILKEKEMLIEIKTPIKAWDSVGEKEPIPDDVVDAEIPSGGL